MQHSEAFIHGFNGLQLYTQRWQPEGEAQGVVLILHGIGEHSSRYANVVNSFVPAGYAVATFDLRGNGKSEGKRGFIMAFDEFREDLNIVHQEVRNVFPDMPLIMYGHSLGGLIALDYVLRDASDFHCLIVSAPSVGEPGFPKPVIMASKVLSVVAPRTILHTGLDPGGISRDEQVVKDYLEDPLVHDMGNARFGGEALKCMDWVNANVGELQLPLLVMHGELDTIAFTKNSRALFESAGSEDKTYREYPGGFHEPHNDIDHEMVLDGVAGWLNVRV